MTRWSQTRRVWAHFLLDSHTLPGQRHSQPTPTSMGQGCIMYACLGVTCHLHFWQNDQGLLRANAVTQGVECTPNKSQHTKLTLKKKILQPFLPGFQLTTFRSWLQRSNQQVILAPFTRTIKEHVLMCFHALSKCLCRFLPAFESDFWFSVFVSSFLFQCLFLLFFLFQHFAGKVYLLDSCMLSAVWTLHEMGVQFFFFKLGVHVMRCSA